MSNKILKNFVSEIDLFIQDFDSKHPTLSKSQQKEIEKNGRIAYLRDHEHREAEQKDIFE